MIRQFFTSIRACVVIGAVAGCVAIDSPNYDFDLHTDTTARGAAYSLPKGVFDVAIVREKSSFSYRLIVDGPYYIPDAEATFHLDLTEAPFHEETTTISYFEGTTFIRQIEIVSSGKLDEALVEAAKRYSTIKKGLREGALESGLLSTEILVAGPVRIDLHGDDLDALTDSFDLALRRNLELLERQCSEKYAKEEPDPVCYKIRSMRQEVARAIKSGAGFVSIKVEPVDGHGKPHVGRAGSRAPVPNCKTGVCYRPMRSYRVSARFGPSARAGRYDGAEMGVIVQLPNGSAPVPVPLDRAALADSNATVLFDFPGLPSRVVTFHQSDGAEAIVLPFEVVGEALGAVASGVTGENNGSSPDADKPDDNGGDADQSDDNKGSYGAPHVSGRRIQVAYPRDADDLGLLLSSKDRGVDTTDVDQGEDEGDATGTVGQ